MRAFVVVPVKPSADEAIGFREVAEIMLPSAFFFQAAKEAFNQAVLLRRIRRDVFLRQLVIMAGGPETTALKHQAVIASYRRHFVGRS